MSGGDSSIVCRAFDYLADSPVQEEPIHIAADAVVIVEGIFLHRDELRELWDVSVSLDVPFAVSVRRMAARDDTKPDPNDPSMRRYVEGQRIYLETCKPAQRASYVLAN